MSAGTASSRVARPLGHSGRDNPATKAALERNVSGFVRGCQAILQLVQN